MSDTPVTTSIRDSIALVEISNPPVNASSAHVRAALLQAVRDCEAAGVNAAVLTGAGRCFMAGGDITEFGQPPILPHLPDVYDAIEASPVVYIAAIHGMALGGGFELAMACDYRIAAHGTKFGLPEVNMGLVPGAGGSQRAPRLIGVEAALDLVTTGKTLDAAEVLALGGLDSLFEGDPQDAGLAIAEGFPDRPTPVSARPVPAHDPNIFAETRQKLTAKSRGEQAPLMNVDAVEWAATLPYSEGQPKERALHLALRDTAESRGLRHAFLAERCAAKPEAIKGGVARDIAHVAVVGGGLMGAGIGYACLSAGLSVTLLEQNDEAASAGAGRMDTLVQSALKRGKLDENGADDLKSRLSATSDYDQAAGADLAIEAVFEDLAVKKSVFARLDEALGPNAILATNTSYIDPREIFDGIAHPDRCLGLHFFSPAHVMKLVEIVRTPGTSPDTLATGFALAKKLKKQPVLSGICDGFIGNRILSAYRRQADYLLLDGALPAEIDSAMRAFGMPMGPYELQDLTGLQIAWANRKRQAPTRPATERYVTIADQLCEADRLGQRSGRGWYRYAEGSRTPEPDPEVTALIEAASDRAGVTRQLFTQDDIQSRLMAVMINEGARIVEEGIAERPGDVDVVKLNGYGFPRWRGGPMAYGDEIGLDTVRADFDRIEAQSPGSWQRSELLGASG